MGVRAGTYNATIDATTPLTDVFTINFNGVTFSGSQFYLYLSKDGLSSISAGDVKYAGPFLVANFTGGPNHVTFPNGSFYEGTIVTDKLLAGPIPIAISNDFKYVKVFDGSTTSVSVSVATISIVPGIALSPASGPAGETVTVTGGGFPSSKTVDIQYSYSRTFWNNTVKAVGPKNLTTGVSTTSVGYWTRSITMVDVMQQINVPTVGPTETVAITIGAALEPSPHTVYATAIYTENSAFVSQLISFDSTGSSYDSTDGAFTLTNKWGSYNGSTSAPVVAMPTVNVVSLGSLIIAGNQSGVGATVSFILDGKLNAGKYAVSGGTSLGSITADSSGNWNTTIPMSVLSLGLHVLFVVGSGSVLWFQLDSFPAVVLTPSHGPVGSTVTVHVYGFPANSDVWVYWDSIPWGDDTAYNLVNGTTGASGTFTGAVAFTVPSTYGYLKHFVYGISNASVTFPGATALNTTIFTDVGSDGGYTKFLVDPTMAVSPTSTASDGSTITVTVSGFTPACTVDGFENALGYDCEDWQIKTFNQNGFPVNPFWAASLDNFPLATSSVNVGSAYAGVTGNSTGYFTLTFPAAGLRPGLHVVELNNGYGGHQLLNVCSVSTIECVSSGVYGPTLMQTFTVTTAGDPISDSITALGTTFSGITSSLTSIQSTLSSITSSIGTMQSSLATITSDVSGLGSQLTSISSSVSALGTQLTGIASTLSSISSSLSTVATNAQNAATQAQNAATQASDAVSGSSTAQTYVLVVAVLAAITLVLELAILVRKLS